MEKQGMCETGKQGKGSKLLERLGEVVVAGVGVAVPWVPAAWSTVRLAREALKTSPSVTDEWAQPAPGEPPVTAELPGASLDTLAPEGGFQRLRVSWHSAGGTPRILEIALVAPPDPPKSTADEAPALPPGPSPGGGP